MADLNTQSARHPHIDRGDDLYETPPEAVHALLANYDVPNVLWEPACGPGSIVRVLRGSNRIVYATDLIDYGSPDQDEGGWDFLLETQLPIGVEAIVTNPPYKDANAFVRHALNLCPKVIMLLRLAFLEGTGRSDIIDGALSMVMPFRNRLPMMHRADWDGPKVGTGAMAFAWFVWDANHVGAATIHRISWSALNDTGRSMDISARRAIEGIAPGGEIEAPDIPYIGSESQHDLWEGASSLQQWRSPQNEE